MPRLNPNLERIRTTGVFLRFPIYCCVRMRHPCHAAPHPARPAQQQRQSKKRTEWKSKYVSKFSWNTQHDGFHFVCHFYWIKSISWRCCKRMNIYYMIGHLNNVRMNCIHNIAHINLYIYKSLHLSLLLLLLFSHSIIIYIIISASNYYVYE